MTDLNDPLPAGATDGHVSLVTRSDHDGVATLTLNRPDKLNALNPKAFVALRVHLEAIEASSDVRCVVLRGAGRSFCAGHDLASIAAKERAPSKHYEPEVIDELASLSVPTIAQIHGHCLTGGLELALACDLLIAGTSAKFGDTHGQWGLVPAWGMSVRLPERVGLARAKELMFTSRIIDASAAAQIGLVDRCVPDDELARTVADLAEEISANSAGTNSRVKRLIGDRLTLDPVERLQREREFHYGLPADMRERIAGAG